MACAGDLPAAPPVQQPAAPAPPQQPCEDDNNPCTDEVVDANGNCTHVPQLRACDDGDACTFDDRCDAQGKCAGTAITCTDDPRTCGAKRRCNGTAQCEQTFPDNATSCHVEGIIDGHCDGAGRCAGEPAPECVTDSCFQRQRDASTGECKIVNNNGRAVYEYFDDGWTYSYEQRSDAKLAFRVVVEDHPLYLLYAPGIHQKMLSDSPDEANDCDWCSCASDCAFSPTEVQIHTSKNRLPGMVPLKRYVDSNITHRDSVVPIDGWIVDVEFHGFVCPPHN
jgi:hypothetical protein